MYFIFLIIISVIFGVEVSKVRYDGYQVIRIVPKNPKEVKIMQDIENQYRNNTKMEFWNTAHYPNGNWDVLVPPNALKDFKNKLTRSNLTFKVMIKNVQDLLDRSSSFSSGYRNGDFNWNIYHYTDTIYSWLQSLAVEYPNIVTLIHVGKTYEGRNITGVKISYKEGNKGVFIEGGIHARERISPATSTYIINQLLTSQDYNVKSIAQSRDWYIFPVTNPDGYEYTKTDEFWRKNRNPITSECIGVDLNRNWGYKWMHSEDGDDPCEEIYAGHESFSENETRSLARFIDTIADTLEGYISLHSYGQFLLIPFGHNEHEVPENNNELHRIGNIAVTALAKRYGTKYIVMNIYNYSIISGTSVDWVMGFHRHLKFVYAYELRDQSTFLLPPEQIIPTGEETLDSLVSIIQELEFELELERNAEEDC